jgi:hypothetical protein
MQQMRARPASCGTAGPLLTTRTAKCVAIRQQLPARRLLVAAVPPQDDSTQPQTSQQDAGSDGEDINSRILSGEFTDSGSTKEKLTRPIRKALAQDPVGIGEWCCCSLDGGAEGSLPAPAAAGSPSLLPRQPRITRSCQGGGDHSSSRFQNPCRWSHW